MTRANRLFSAVLAVGLAGLTSACASGWHEAYSNKRNDVELVRLTHDVQFAAGAEALSGSERAELDTFLAGINAGSGDEAWIDAGSDPLGAARSASIMKSLSARGIVAAKDNLAYGAAPQADELRLVIGRYVVTPPECPDWRKPSDKDFDNTLSSNYGCSTQTNLGMMVANPHDLLEGRTFGGADNDRASLAIDAYRKGNVKSLTVSGTGGGN